MRIATILSAVLIIAAPISVAAQAARPAADQPEVFGATAQAKRGPTVVSSTLEFHISRYTPEFDRTSIETGLRQGGYTGFLAALRKAPEVGRVVLAGGQAFPIRYARQTVAAGGRTIVLVTDRPVFFLGSGSTSAKPRAGYEVGVIQLQLNGTAGRGSMAAAARVRPDGTGGVLLDDYADELIELSKVTRRP